MTDQVREPDPEGVIREMPRGCLVILRDYDAPDRVVLAQDLRRICRRRGVLLSVAGDLQLAKEIKADGYHLPEYQTLNQGLKVQLYVSKFLLTGAVHGLNALRRARHMGLDLALLSPVFQTQSHPEKKGLGVYRFAAMIRLCGCPVAALGGITAQTRQRLPKRVAACAAISGVRSLTRGFLFPRVRRN